MGGLFVYKLLIRTLNFRSFICNPMKPIMKYSIPTLHPVFISIFIGISFLAMPTMAQKVDWKNVSNEFGLTTNNIQVFASTSNTLNDSAFKAYYVLINTNVPNLQMGVDTTLYRRLTPSSFYERLDQPTVVMNASFFEFKNNTNLNVLVHNGNLLAFNKQDIDGKGKDTLTYTHVLNSAMGMQKNGKMDIAYTYTDSNSKWVFYQQNPMTPIKNRNAKLALNENALANLKKWKLDWAVGGGPVLVKDGAVFISNNEEKKFAGKAIADHHPRTAMGYTKDGHLILLAVQGRMKNIAVGTTLTETSQIFIDLGAVEAINLDGGGSSCLLINGKETIKPSDPTGQRPVPAVFFVK
jgi:exopolysaccharide biosynthesis protein